jgi:hypothetical protein
MIVRQFRRALIPELQRKKKHLKSSFGTSVKAEVEKGFVRTAVDHESVDPKAQINLVNGDDRAPLLFFLLEKREGGFHLRSSQCRKGIRVNIPEPKFGYLYGDVSEPGDGGRCPGKSSLFFLTVRTTLESRRAEIGSDGRQSALPFEASGA